MDTKIKHEKRQRRHKRVRAKVSGTVQRPRLYVFRSAKHIYAQLIDDEKGKTLISVKDNEIKVSKPASRLKEPAFAKASASAKASADKSADKSAGRQKDDKKEIKTRKAVIAFEVGKLVAQKAFKNKIEKIVFDRGIYKYHGRVKAVADGAREGGLKF